MYDSEKYLIYALHAAAQTDSLKAMEEIPAVRQELDEHYKERKEFSPESK